MIEKEIDELKASRIEGLLSCEGELIIIRRAGRDTRLLVLGIPPSFAKPLEPKRTKGQTYTWATFVPSP